MSSRIACRSVFDGIVPVWIDTPPTRSRRSTTAPLLPSFAACTAARWPPGPEPITSRSRSTSGSIRGSVFGSHQGAQALVLLAARGTALEVSLHAGHGRLRVVAGELELHVAVQHLEARIAPELGARRAEDPFD